MFKRPDILSRISLFPERPAMTESVTALSTCDHLSIERAYQQLQRLRKLVVQAEQLT